jgi:cyclopropane fatty-acyl-phospholipid synthase-like methyltransferase
LVFSKREIADYYNTTQVHYERWWDLKRGLSLHYGIWEKGTSNFKESLANTNRTLMELSAISESDKVLDAGCGVGGAALYINENKNAQVVGITLSEKQFAYATLAAKAKNATGKVSFKLMDYSNTTFEDESFDVVWACESVSTAVDKTTFIKEAFRVLKKGGRLILSDFFLTDVNQADPNSWIKKWGDTWSISNFVSADDFKEKLENCGFNSVTVFDYTDGIRKSAKRMYYASLLGAIPSETYNLFHPKVSRFAKGHYKCGFYQYKALKENLWKYNIVLAVKQ